MNFNSTNPRCVGNACFEPQAILSEEPATVNLENNAGLIIQAEAAYYITTRVGNQRNVRLQLLLINGSNVVSTAVGSPFTIIG